MTGWVLVSALWLGLLTSISPCPLATNVAAISFITRRVNKTGFVLYSGLLYALGRMLAYVALGAAILAGMLASGRAVLFLQRYLNQALGPVLIVVGLVLLGRLGGAGSLNLVGEKLQRRVRRGGAGWAFPLGFLFALSFCPVSAGLFFGMLLPLAAKAHFSLVLPLVYGVGTAAPVLLFALLFAFASQKLGQAFDRITHIERGVRWLTGVVIILAGLYCSLVYVYELPLGLR